MKLLLICIFCFFSSLALADSNGSERGGGDSYVAEFRNIKNTIDANLNSWVENKVIILNSDDLALYQQYSKKVEIYSQDHVYRVEGNPLTEVEFVNLPANPALGRSLPYIIIGRARWDQLIAKHSRVDIELMALHELLSASGIKDGKFEFSYNMKLESMKTWSTFKSTLFSSLLKINQLKLEAYRTDMLKVVKTFFSTAAMDSDYIKCMENKGNSRHAYKRQKEFCSPFYKKISNGLQAILNENLIIPFNENYKKVNDDIDNLKSQIAKDENSQTTYWAEKIIDNYSETFLKVDAEIINAAGRYEQLFSDKCGHFQTQQELIVCFVDYANIDYSIMIKSTYPKAISLLNNALGNASLEISKQVDPL